MNITSIKSYNKVFKQTSANTAENKANNLAIDDACSDKYIYSKKTTKDNKNNTWKWLLGGVIAVALIVGLFIEKKVSNAAKAEKEAVEKAKKELEERLTKEKDELENKLKEEQKKWDDFFKNNSTNNDKNTPSSGNSGSSANTNNTTGDSPSHTTPPSSPNGGSGKRPRQSVDESTDTPIATKEEVEEIIEKNKQTDKKIETLRKELEKIERDDNTEFTEQQKRQLEEYRKEKEEELSSIPEERIPVGQREEQLKQLRKVKTEMRAHYNSSVNNVLDSTFKNSSEQILTIKNAIKDADGSIVLFYCPDYKIGSDLIHTGAEELNCIIKSVSVENLSKNTFETHTGLLPYDNKKIIWNIIDLEQATPEQLSNIKGFLQVVKDKSINGVLVAKIENPVTVDTIKNKKIFLNSILTEEDIAQVLEQIMKPFAEDNVNYKTLSKELINNANGNFYTHKSISAIARKRIMEITDANSDKISELLTEQELLQYCRECKPDITKEIVESLKSMSQK